VAVRARPVCIWNVSAVSSRYRLGRYSSKRSIDRSAAGDHGIRAVGAGRRIWPAAGAMDGPAGIKEVAGTGTEQTQFRSGKQGVTSNCDAECDAILMDRVEVLARAVVLVAGMNTPEAAREAVLARLTAELTNAAEQSPRTSARAGESAGG